MSQPLPQQFSSFITSAPTPFHAVAAMKNILDAIGFMQLSELEDWTLKSQGQYYVIRDGSIIAFVLGDMQQGLRLIGAHTDSPCLKIRPIADVHQAGYLQLGVEVYGSALLSTWFDRDLSIAGRVQYLNQSGVLASTLIDFCEPVAIIPSLAIHLNRNANTQQSINPQTDILPIMACLNTDHSMDFNQYLMAQIKQQGITDCQKILTYHLSLYDTQKPQLVGGAHEFLAAARQDNLVSCYAGLQALCARAMLNDSGLHPTALLICHDHEEVGSVSATGADSRFLTAILKRITAWHGDTMEKSAAHSMLLSVDNAHGIHPNYMHKHDQQHQPILNQGVVLKHNANQSYATTDKTTAILKYLAAQCQVPLQFFTSRADLRCGSTIGPMTAACTGIQTIDLGIPTFAMHSIRELSGVSDLIDLTDLLKAYYINRLPDMGWS